MSTDRFNRAVRSFKLLAVIGGIVLFVIIAPFLIWAATMVVVGGIALAILSFIVYAVWEALAERRGSTLSQTED